MILPNLHPVHKLIDGEVFVPPYRFDSYDCDHYENPILGPLGPLSDPAGHIEVARRHNLAALIMGSYYDEQPVWANSEFEYNLIDLASWREDFAPKGSKRKAEFRKLREHCAAHPLNISVLSNEEWLALLPPMCYTDSTLGWAQMLATHTRKAAGYVDSPVWRTVCEAPHQPARNLLPIRYEEPDGQLVGLGLLLKAWSPRFNDFVVFSPCAIDLKGRQVKRMTYWLCDFVSQIVGIRYLDIWNLALSTRENYKGAFFTDTIYVPCWSNGLDYPWLRPL